MSGPVDRYHLPRRPGSGPASILDAVGPIRPAVTQPLPQLPSLPGQPGGFGPLGPIGRRVNKVWGFERILVSTELYTLKELWIDPGFMSSAHYHVEKDETFVVRVGTLVLEVPVRFGAERPEGGPTAFDRDDLVSVLDPCYEGLSRPEAEQHALALFCPLLLGPGDMFRLYPGIPHRFRSGRPDASCVVQEVSTRDLAADSYRITRSGPVDQIPPAWGPNLNRGN